MKPKLAGLAVLSILLLSALVVLTPGAGALTLTKIADPASLPASGGQGNCWSNDGAFYMEATDSTSAGIKEYSVSGATFTAVSFPAVNQGQACAFSPDDTYLAVASLITPFIKIYTHSGTTFTQLSNPATLPTVATDVAWDPTGTLLVVAHDTSPYITIYQRSGSTFTKLSNPSTLPGGQVRRAAFSHDGAFLALGEDVSPYVFIYSVSGTTFTKVADPATLPTNIVFGIAWSPSDAYLSVGENAAPFFIQYSHSGTTFTKITDPSTLPANIPRRISWSPGGTYVYFGQSASPYVFGYSLSGTTFTKVADPATLPGGAIVQGTSFSPNSTYLTLTEANSPFIVIYTLSTPDPAVPQIPTAIGVASEPHVGAGGACQLVNWTAPAAGPAPTGYSVFVHTGDPVPSLVNPMNSSGDWVYTGHVGGLSKDTCSLTWAQDQWWAVVATNAAGEGIAGGPKNNTTVAGPPSFVQATATNTTLVHVNWSVAIGPNSSATGWSVFSKASPEGSPSWALNASGYAFEGHVDKPTQQFDVSSLTTGTTYCFRVEGTNASAWGEGDISGTTACATTGNITLPPVLSGVYVPCSTFALSWSLPNGTIDGYRIDQSAPALPFVNRSFFVPPDGNFSLRLLNVSFPQVSGELDYAAFAHSPLGYSASSNVVNFTPPAVSTIGDCGLQWGGQSQADFAAQAGISVPAAQSMVSIFLIVIGAGVGLVAMGNGAGVVGGVGAGLLLSVALGLVPAWAVMLALVAGAALGIVGAMLGMGLRTLNRGGLGR